MTGIVSAAESKRPDKVGRRSHGWDTLATASVARFDP